MMVSRFTLAYLMQVRSEEPFLLKKKKKVFRMQRKRQSYILDITYHYAIAQT